MTPSSSMEGPGAADRARLDVLDWREIHLALVKERYQNIRASALYTRLDPRGREWIQIAAELPLMLTNLCLDGELDVIHAPPRETRFRRMFPHNSFSPPFILAL
jgi:hypothetical protein